MPTYKMHTAKDGHEGQKTGLVRSWTRGALIDAPEGEFSDLQANEEYNLVKRARTPEDGTE